MTQVTEANLCVQTWPTFIDARNYRCGGFHECDVWAAEGDGHTCKCECGEELLVLTSEEASGP